MKGWVIICYFAEAKRFVARYRVLDHSVHHKITDAVKIKLASMIYKPFVHSEHNVYC